MVCTKGFDAIIFWFSRSLLVWKIRFEWQFCQLRLSQGGKSITRFSFFRTRWLRENGKTLNLANLSNEYNIIEYFLKFLHSRVENRSHDLFSNMKYCEKNKMDNSQNGYSSGVEKTGKIMKIILNMNVLWNSTIRFFWLYTSLKTWKIANLIMVQFLITQYFLLSQDEPLPTQNTIIPVKNPLSMLIEM